MRGTLSMTILHTRFFVALSFGFLAVGCAAGDDSAPTVPPPTRQDTGSDGGLADQREADSVSTHDADATAMARPT